MDVVHSDNQIRAICLLNNRIRMTVTLSKHDVSLQSLTEQPKGMHVLVVFYVHVCNCVRGWEHNG